MVCDGYSAYESFVNETEGTELVQCWSHTRREFIKAEKRDEERVKWVLRQIQRIYDIEESVRGEPPNKVLKARERETKPLVMELFTFLKTTIAEETFVPSDPFLKAAGYPSAGDALNREEPLKAFLENPDLPLDTNHLERELRPQAVGRKNWMFHVTKEGGSSRCHFLQSHPELHPGRGQSYRLSRRRPSAHPDAPRFEDGIAHPPGTRVVGDGKSTSLPRP